MTDLGWHLVVRTSLFAVELTQGTPLARVWVSRLKQHIETRMQQARTEDRDQRIKMCDALHARYEEMREKAIMDDNNANAAAWQADTAATQAEYPADQSKQAAENASRALNAARYAAQAAMEATTSVLRVEQKLIKVRQENAQLRETLEQQEEKLDAILAALHPAPGNNTAQP